MHYVSQYNYFRSLDRLARSRDDAPDLNEAIAGLSRFSLRDILNNQEIVNMFQQRSTLEMLKRWADSGVKIDGDAIREHLQARERYFVPQYVLKVSTPRYHASQDCGFLKSAFENIETPAEITQQGPEKFVSSKSSAIWSGPSTRTGPSIVSGRMSALASAFRATQSRSRTSRVRVQRQSITRAKPISRHAFKRQRTGFVITRNLVGWAATFMRHPRRSTLYPRIPILSPAGKKHFASS